MFLLYSLLTILILVVAYLVILPLSKSRPVFIREMGCAALSVAGIAIIGTFLHPWWYLVAILLGALVYLSKPWIVIGISRDQVKSAVERAAAATRTECVKSTHGYRLDSSCRLRLFSIGNSMHSMLFSGYKNSKKAKLTKNVGRKFIQNYFIKTEKALQ